MANDLVDGLNPQQRAAVTAGEGPVLVLAGPGSGKTRVLTHRIAYLVRDMGVYPDRIVAVTFTNKAAGEMRARCEKLLGGALDGLQIGTFHAICARILRREADSTPFRRDYAIFDTDDQQSLIKQVLGELNVDVKKFSPGRVLNAISSAKNELMLPDDLRASDYFGEIVRRAYPRYQQLLLQNNALDFDDLLMQTVLLMREKDGIRQKYQQRFQFVLVDEFQDTNTAQYELVRLFGKPQENVFVVGDEDQGIYAFRGADYRNVMNFRVDYPNAQVILLEQNYRSTQIVLDAARAVIDKNRNRTPKALFTDKEGGARVTVYEAYDEGDEGRYITTQIKALMRRDGLRYGDFAVMYRVNAQSRAIEDACVAGQLPYHLIGGVGFYKRREVRDILAYLRLVNNPDEQQAFLRVVNVPGRGIGKTSLDKFIEWKDQRGLTIGVALEALMRGEPSPLTGRAAKSLVEFAGLLSRLRVLTTSGDLTVLYDEIISSTGYTVFLNEISDTPEQMTERMDNLTELRGVLAERKDLALEDFLEEISLSSEVDRITEDSDAVTLLTLHAAKGLEYPVVFITGLEDGILPHSRTFDMPEEMAEERRLLYVGLTRAREKLFLTYTFRRALYGGYGETAIPSRFLSDIPDALTEGASVKVQNMRDRAGYQQLTRWERSPAPDAPAFGSGSGKVIPFPTGAGALKRAAPPPAPNAPYKTGQRVRHSKFGEGTVIDVKASVGDFEVMVKFDTFGTKLLAASFAKLEVL